MPNLPIVSEYIDEDRERRITELEERIAALEQALSVDSSGGLTINASSLTIQSSSMTVNTPLVTFAGVVDCQTIRATTVIGASYTPGAGNVW